MKKKNLIVFALAGVLLAVSFFLPGAVLAIRDAAIQGKAEAVTMDEAELQLISSLNAEEKLRIAGDVDAAVITLDSGVGMDEAQAAEAAMTTLDFDSEWALAEVSPKLLVSGDGRSFVLWEAVVASDYAYVDLMLDDETGALLGYTIHSDPTEPELTEPASTEPFSAEDRVLSSQGGYVSEEGEVTYGIYDYYGVTAPGPEEYIELSRAVLAPAGLEPSGLSHSASGVLVYVENSDLTIRITITESVQVGQLLTVNMG